MLSNLVSLSCLLLAPLSVLAYDPPNPSELEMGPLVRYDAPEKATASIILLHGVGNSSDVFTSFPPAYYAQERFRHINFIFPNAPIRNTPYWHMLMNQDPNTRSWFNCSEYGMFAGFDETQYWQIVDYIHDLVVNETARGIPPERVIVGGFSQGGMATFGALASLRQKLAGFVIFSSAGPTNWTVLEDHYTWQNKETPIFHGNGLADPAITSDMAVGTQNHFEEYGYKHYYLHLYPGMRHQADFEQNDLDVEEWVAKLLPKKWKKWVRK